MSQIDHTDRRSLIAGLALGAALAGAASARAAAPPPPPWTSEGWAERPGGRLHWVSMGEGPPLVLLHKLGGWVADWRFIAPILAKSHKVIAFDMPGHGESTMDRPAPYVMTLGESAAMIVAALADMGIERFAVAGVSLGGCCGVVMAADYPEAVTRLVLISTALGLRADRAALAKSDAASTNYDAQGRALARTAEQNKSFGSIDPRVNDEQNQSRLKAGAWVRASEHGVALAGLADILPRVQCPVLLIYADRGPYPRFEAVGRAKLRNVQVAVIKDTGSFTPQEKPAETAAAMLPFLAG